MALNIRDFIALHYITDKNNSEFWRDISKIDLPDTLSNKLDHWKNHLPILEDFSGQTDYLMFTEAHHIVVMHGLNLFNTESIKKEYLSLPEYVRRNAYNIVESSKYNDNIVSTTTHKEHLRIIREVI